jgi:hypothetical protein
MSTEDSTSPAPRLGVSLSPEIEGAALWEILGATPGQVPPNELLSEDDERDPEKLFLVVLLQSGPSWIDAVRVIRKQTQHLLRQCRDLAQQTPSRLGEYPLEKARSFCHELTKTGALAVVQNGPWPYPLDLCRALARHPNAPPELLTFLARSLDPETLAGLAEHPSTPVPLSWGVGLQHPEAFWRNPAQWLWLLSDPGLVALSDSLLFAFLRVTSGAYWPMLAGAVMLRDTLRNVLALNFLEQVSEEFRAQLLRDPLSNVRAAFAEKTSREEEMSLLARDPEAHVRCGLAKNPHTPEPILESLLDPFAFSVWEALAGRETLSERLALALITRGEEAEHRARDIYEKLSLNGGLSVQARRALLRKENLPASIAERLAETKALPDDCIELLRKHHESSVRRALAARGDLSPAHLAYLLCDENQSVRQAALANPNLPREVLALLRRAGANKTLSSFRKVKNLSDADRKQLAELGAFARSWFAPPHSDDEEGAEEPHAERENDDGGAEA